MNLRKAAEMALESWDFFFSQAHPEVVGLMYGSDWAKIAKERTEALRQALAQPEWVGLTKEDMPVGDNPMFDTDEFAFGAAWAQAKLKEKNGG